MKRELKVVYNGAQIGESYISLDGLYYQIDCCCNRPKNEIYRLIAVGESTEADLGICLPFNGKLTFSKRISKKRLPFDVFGFILREHGLKKIVPLKEDEPFRYISGLKGGKICRINDGVGVILPN